MQQIESSSDNSASMIQGMVQAHDAMADQEIRRLRTLSLSERSVLIELACETAAAMDRSRRAAGLPAVEPACWPASTWEFLRKHAARVRT